jgi:hypothetical protein
MRRLAMFWSCVLVVSVCFAFAGDGKYVEVKKPFANIYEFLDPKSNVLKQVKQGDVLDLVYEGTSWYQVRVKEKVGWLEKRAGIVVDSPRFMFLSMSPVTIGGFVVLLLVAGGIVFFVIYRQRTGGTE